MEKFQGSLRSGLQRDTNTLNNFEDQRLCSTHTRCTSQCGTFYRDAAGPHPGAGKYRNVYTIQKNIGHVAHETISEESSQVAYLTPKLATSQAENARL